MVKSIIILDYNNEKLEKNGDIRNRYGTLYKL